MERFDQAVELKDVDNLDPEYRQLLGRVLTIQCDCEIGGPHLYVDRMLPDAPSRSMQLVVARTAAEEIDHFRKMARIAGDIGTDVSHVLRWDNQQRYVEAFRTHITTWEDFSVFGFLVDRVGKYQLDEFLGASYQPLERAVLTMLPEEAGHIEFGTNATAEMALQGGESKERAQKAVNYWYAKSLDMFGMSESKRSERFIHWGLKRRTNSQAREDYIKEVNPLIEKMGLEIPDPLEGRLYL
jgi:ring-1,2-phenylacetyl-CoA epoxidase subunit PaaA